SGPYEYSLDGEFFAQVAGFPQTLPNQASGSYTLHVQDAADCTTTLNLLVPEAATLALDFRLDEEETILLGDSLLLFPTYNFVPASWTWTPTVGLTQPDSVRTFAAPTTTTRYRLEMQDTNGCVVSEQVLIIVDEQVPVYIPSAFSPNGDGHNDRLVIFGKGIEEVETFQIFDRWGNQVFADGGYQANDPDRGWDGQLNGSPLNAGVFVYWARLRLSGGQRFDLQGEVLLLR
ncbi:MAG: gliding motility-associated C-terminal domain-containing protein, partial [Bacteroidetes bacterium]